MCPACLLLSCHTLKKKTQCRPFLFRSEEIARPQHPGTLGVKWKSQMELRQHSQVETLFIQNVQVCAPSTETTGSSMPFILNPEVMILSLAAVRKIRGSFQSPGNSISVRQFSECSRKNTRGGICTWLCREGEQTRPVAHFLYRAARKAALPQC